MDAQITPLSGQSAVKPASLTVQSGRDDSFHNILQQQQQSTASKATPMSKVFLGEISQGNRTVSELLMQNDQLRSSTWEVLSLPVNRDKDYTTLQAGTRIYYDPNDGRLSWSGQKDAPADAVARATKTHLHTTASVAAAQEIPPTQTAATNRNLGVISKEHPTVSHLLKAHPDFSTETWGILSSTVNQGKEFTKIPLGAHIHINPTTQEIGWQTRSQEGIVAADAKQLHSPEKIEAAPLTNAKAETITAPAEDLTEAVQPFLGTPYRDINCYELLVKGLGRMDILYGGKDGLFSKLTRMAQDNGMPENAYLNGEGIVKAAGSLVLSKKYNNIGDWQEASASLYSEMEPLLGKGQILSFSTERRGHTGIVSQQDNHWTFINSGRLDNAMTRTEVSKGVGEENLKKELNNWFKLAHTNKESLVVTLGRLDQQKVITAYNQQSEVSGRI